MRQLEIENELRDVVSRIVTQVELSTKQGRLDVNLSLEDALIPILRAAYNLPQLVNLNRRQKNFPGIDLGDDHDRVAFQVTSTTSLEKIKKTLTTFMDNQFFNTFDELFVLTLTKKQSSYSQASLDQITHGRLGFIAQKHVIDLGDVLAKVAGLRIPAQERVLNDFKIILGDVKAYLDFTSSDTPSSHALTTNLIQLRPPTTLYVAELALDDKHVIHEARQRLGFKKHSAGKSLSVKLALLLNGCDDDAWVRFEDRIFAFDDITCSGLVAVVDVGSIETLNLEDLLASGVEDNVNLAKQLLAAYVKQALKSHSVFFYREDRSFFFKPHDPDDTQRKEIWRGKKKSTRRVYERLISQKDPTKTAHHVHLAFELSYIPIAGVWYAMVVPSWLYTYDGHRKSRFHDKLLSKQKRLEFNQTVRNIVRFLAYFLSSTDTPGQDGRLFGELIELTCDDALVEGQALGVDSQEGNDDEG
ncbi:hypothetical protein DFR29_12025 [Tahibacter aquaticus]|uniref:SMEK domain-containing protein n=1 Tax=Tahibacter aquaticus TaxID=520092 RepID=A0A4R6YMF6_9GAMM|nr:SMEK domain-containing protein [Tahibacter aquaticus]TDR38524.1 hypothetical protein DFR29_12025 [Tahibacter aquaticus]